MAVWELSAVRASSFGTDLTGYLSMAARYSKAASKKVGRAMHERKKGTLKSGSGKKVTSRSQAIAIGLSEARRAGKKVPKKAAKKKASRKS
jgi:hypothetical protein